MCNHKHVFEALSISALAVKVMKGSYAPVSQQYSKELKNLVDDMLNQNPKNRPSIIEILTRPFLIAKVQNYMKKIYSEREKYEPELIQSLVDQSKSLGFSIVEQIPKKIETPSKKSKADNKKSEKVSRQNSNSKQKLKQQRNNRYQELKQKLRKQIEERNRAQDRLKEMNKKSNQKKFEDRKKIAERYSFQKSKPKRQDASISESSRTRAKTDDLSTEAEKSKKCEEERVEEMKNFKIVEDYDMDYEEYSDKENDKIFEEDEEQENEENQDIRSSANKQKVQAQKTQPKLESPSNQERRIEKIVEDVKIKVDKLQKEVKEKTVNITNIRNEMSKLDFVISSDSEGSDKEERAFNPAYTHLKQKINDLKEKIIAQLGRKGYTSFLKFFYSNCDRPEKEKIVQAIGNENLGVWHFAESIAKLQKVISRIPVYSS